MKNCLVLGTGRSGTSAIMGMLAPARYYMGDWLHTGDQNNPQGLLRGREINAINEELIQRVLPRPRRWLGLRAGKLAMDTWQAWLALVPRGTQFSPDRDLVERIRRQTSHVPFCFKDPRFSYTLPVWRPHLTGEVAYVCAFRHPDATANSIVKACQTSPYLHSLAMDRARALEVWRLMYEHILESHYEEGGTWLFLHYD